MSRDVKRFKRRQKIIKELKSQPKKPSLADVTLVSHFLSEKEEVGRVDQSIKNIHKSYSIKWDDIKVSDLEVEEFINQFNTKEASIDAIMGPAFLSLIDGTMRAFKIGTKQGLTASRIYNECKSFTYNKDRYIDYEVDRFTEHLNEQNSIKEFDNKSKYEQGGIFQREGEESLGMRDQAKMDRYKREHFKGEDAAQDEYSPRDKVYKDNKTAFKQVDQIDEPSRGERHPQSAETDHIIPCTELCNNLKSNKALNSQDIKDILNNEANLAVTNHDLNLWKGGKTNEELIKKHSEDFSIKQREEMNRKSQKARSNLENETNKKVVGNIINDQTVKSRLAKGATEAASNRAVGDVIIFFIKPLYFELSDCMRNGIEKGVDAHGFLKALKKRFGRLKDYIQRNVSGMIQGGALNFIKSFFSMLIEGILNCFIGVFKHIVRAISEGIRILMKIIPVLKDSSKTAAEKGDAILKLVALSATALAGIGIESYLNTLGIGEPWSIILASVLSTVVAALVMYLLDKMDLFSLKRNLRNSRIREALELMKNETDEKLENLIDPGKKFRELSIGQA